MEEQPPEGAGAGRGRTDTLGDIGSVTSTLLNDPKVSKNQLYKDYLPLVWGVASRYRGRGLDYDELVNEGAVGLGNAIRRYRPRAKNCFAAYARRWIEGAIRRALKKGFRPEVSLDVEILGDIADPGPGLDTGDRSSSLERDLNNRDRMILAGKMYGKSNKQIAAEVGMTAEGVRAATKALTRRLSGTLAEIDEYEGRDPTARQFLAEAKGYCRHGIGFLCRDRLPPKMPRELLPHNQLFDEARAPEWLTHKKVGHCICAACCPPKARKKMNPERKKPCPTQPILTVVSRCSSISSSSTPSEPLQAVSTRAHRPIFARLSSTG